MVIRSSVSRVLSKTSVLKEAVVRADIEEGRLENLIERAKAFISPRSSTRSE